MVIDEKILQEEYATLKADLIKQKNKWKALRKI